MLQLAVRFLVLTTFLSEALIPVLKIRNDSELILVAYKVSVLVLDCVAKIINDFVNTK